MFSHIGSSYLKIWRISLLLPMSKKKIQSLTKIVTKKVKVVLPETNLLKLKSSIRQRYFTQFPNKFLTIWHPCASTESTCTVCEASTKSTGTSRKQERVSEPTQVSSRSSISDTLSVRAASRTSPKSTMRERLTKREPIAITRPQMKITMIMQLNN